jgi:hypothetical protein
MACTPSATTSRGLRQRQGKVAQATEQVQHPFIRCRLQPFQRLGNHRFVDSGVDLNEIPGR